MSYVRRDLFVKPQDNMSREEISTTVNMLVANGAILETDIPISANVWTLPWEFCQTLADLAYEAGIVARPPDQRRVNKLAEEMKEGRFYITPQGIWLYGHLLTYDGIHRLLAAAKAKMPLKILIVIGLSPAAMMGMDIGRTRSMACRVSIAAQTILGYRKVQGLDDTAWRCARSFIAGGPTPGITADHKIVAVALQVLDDLIVLRDYYGKKGAEGQNIMTAAIIADLIRMAKIYGIDTAQEIAGLLMNSNRATTKTDFAIVDFKTLLFQNKKNKSIGSKQAHIRPEDIRNEFRKALCLYSQNDINFVLPEEENWATQAQLVKVGLKAPRRRAAAAAKLLIPVTKMVVPTTQARATG